MTSYSLTHENLLKLIVAIAVPGREVYAPQRRGEKTFFAPVADVKAIGFDYVKTAESPKDLLFPKYQKLISFEYKGAELEVNDHAETPPPERVLFGSHPCDAVALQRLTDFFSRDIADTFVAQRRDALTVISMSCTKADADCFCTSTGSSPGDTTGSDILLTPSGEGRYYVESLTEKGEALVASQRSLFGPSAPIDKEACLSKVEKKFSPEEIAQKLAGAFGDQIWNDASLRCIGCGVCAFVCPMCSCFDIQDEGSYKKGARVRCWDSCGFSLFTQHTSGHNPRPLQSDRWRQRVMHKFSYQPQQYELLGCVGCGRCSRACPADMNLKEQLIDIAAKVNPV